VSLNVLSNGVVRGLVLAVCASAAIFYSGAQTTAPARPEGAGQSQPALRRGGAASQYAGLPAGVPANSDAFAVAGEERYGSTGPGDPKKGKAAIERYGCGSCHEIAGVTGAVGKVGPPLTGVASRVYIAGVMRNNTVNIVRWIQNPQAFVPNVVMPNLGVSQDDARDIAAYLGTLRQHTGMWRYRERRLAE
jgi:cytochrome c2